MDHLLIPKNPTHLRIEVPVLNGKRYEGPYDSFPERNGWSKLQMAQPDLSLDKIEEVKHLLQEWLFFGLAQEVFGTLTQRAEWTRAGRDGGSVLSTMRLRDLVQQLYRRSKDTSAENSSSAADERIQQTLQIAIDMVNSLSLQKSPLSETDDFIVIVTLCDTIHKSFGTQIDSYRASGTLDLGVYQPLQKRMLSDGWCKRDVHRLSHQLDLASLYLASNLNVPEAHVQHDGCTKFECLKSKVDESKYITRHDERTCNGNCSFVSVEKSDLTSILLSGVIPLISYQDKDDSGLVKLVPATPGTPYVAISHVWSHGLGNPHDNSIPLCQFRRIGELVTKLGVHSEGHPSLFWLDTICFPLHHQEAADRALVYMRVTYTDATAVLVLDRYLEDTESKPLLRTECLVRILVSSWTRRLWTLQEGALAKKLYFNFADELLEMEYTAFLHVAEMTKVTCDGSLEYQPIQSVTSELWEWWKTAISEQPRHLLNSLSNGLRWRGTSVAADEALCLATLAGLDMEKLLKAPEKERMGAFWSLLPALSVQAIFWSGPKLEQPGYRWAPSTFLNQPDALFQDFGTKSSLEIQETSSATCSNKGLQFKCPGVFLNTWRANIGTHLWIRDQSQRWYILHRPGADTIPFRGEANDDEMQTLVLIMKLPLQQAFHGISPESSVTCVIASIYDVDEESDIVYAHTEGTGYLLPAKSPSATELIQTVVEQAEVNLNFSESVGSASGVGIRVHGHSSLEGDENEATVLEQIGEESDAERHMFGNINDLLYIRKDRLKARDEGGRLGLDLGADHFMFDGLELDEDQSWRLD